MMVLSVVLLPTPLRPEETDDLARAHVERDTVQDMALAVVRVDPVQTNQRRPG